MPIGVPRIIYCWGEELPAQWTDIYNFIFRRRMVFLMQYLDDELCNQICGLLINIHMEDRSKELEKKEIERSGLFKGGPKLAKGTSGTGEMGPSSFQSKKTNSSSFEDLLAADEDLGIDENNTLEQYTLQKITMEWLNWNAQFFDYSDEPYLFHLAETLSKDFNKGDARMLYSNSKNLSMPYSQGYSNNATSGPFGPRLDKSQKNYLDIYSPFRMLANFDAQDYDFKNINPLANSCLNDSGSNSETAQAAKRELFKLFNSTVSKKGNQNNAMSKLLTELAQKNWAGKTNSQENLFKSSEKALSQRSLRKEYVKDKTLNNLSMAQSKSNTLNYLDFYSYNDSYNEFRNTPRGKQPERAFQEEEAKKVFVIINSFGGSVGNGITVHDALQFIKAGSLTLALGVAASAASLALAGGTIGERYVTEGCHVMIHQPESSIQGQASDIWIDSQEIMKIRLDVAEIYSLATYRPRHKILRDLDRDFYLTATETIQYGLADEIATNDVMSEIIEMTSKVWDYHDTKQQRLLESRDTSNSGVDTQSQN
jgi:ATP-dependent Clp protease protease subunit